MRDCSRPALVHLHIYRVRSYAIGDRLVPRSILLFLVRRRDRSSRPKKVKFTQQIFLGNLWQKLQREKESAEAVAETKTATQGTRRDATCRRLLFNLVNLRTATCRTVLSSVFFQKPWEISGTERKRKRERERELVDLAAAKGLPPFHEKTTRFSLWQPVDFIDRLKRRLCSWRARAHMRV